MKPILDVKAIHCFVSSRLKLTTCALLVQWQHFCLPSRSHRFESDTVLHIGVQPSGKARGFDPRIPWFESRCPCHMGESSSGSQSLRCGWYKSTPPQLIQRDEAAVASRPHKPKVEGSNPSPATILKSHTAKLQYQCRQMVSHFFLVKVKQVRFLSQIFGTCY